MSDGAKARQVIQVGGRKVELPPGVSVVDWSVERSRHQNPRLRLILEAVRQLELILDSHYFILHCSPEQLARIHDHLAAVYERLETRLGPLLEAPSPVPALDAARERQRSAWAEVRRDVGEDLGPRRRDGERPPRRRIAAAAGRLFSFLQNALGSLMEADPRSVHQADYFLSQRFARDVAEAEALYEAVTEIAATLDGLGTEGREHLERLAERLASDGFVSTAVQWRPAMEFLDRLVHRVLPHLQAVLVMPGVRYAETKALDRLCRGLVVKGLVFLEIQATYRRIATAPLPGVLEMKARLRRLLEELASLYASLDTFVPSWRRDLAKRRALMLLPDGGARGAGEREGER